MASKGHLLSSLFHNIHHCSLSLSLSILIHPMNLMDIVESANDFQDWELIKTNSDSESVPVILPDSDDSFDEVESSGLIWANYFSLDSQDRNRERVDDGESVGSDNPSWIDPGLEEDPARRLSKEARESWPDSSSERSEDRKFRDLEGAYELGFREHEEKEVSSGVIEGKVEEAEDSGNYCMDSTEIDGDSAESNDIAENPQVGVEGDVNFDATSQVLGGEVNESEGVASGGSKNSGELEKRGIVWWKMPMEFLKYCVVRMSPVWTVSVAAAFMGLLILGRRLYKLKRKTRGLKIKVAVDEKKASQVMSRAARLNEAFSVVKLVPVIRPSLPAIIGSTSNWPLMSLR